VTERRIGFLGLGEMGGRMARRLEAHGHRVTVWNRTPERARGFANTAPSPAGATAGADLAITMVSDVDALDQVTRGLPRELLVVDMSTTGPAGARLLAERFDRACDAPVGGSLSEAEEGSLAIYLGGEPAVADEVEPVLRGLGEVHRMGPLGSGQAIKVIGNLLMLSNVAAVGEALAMAGAAGLDPEATLSALAAGPGDSRAVRAKGPMILAGEFGPPARFPVRLAHKDARLAREMGGGPYAELAERIYGQAEQAGRGEQDYSAVAARG
jgi:3-hydroxyisobutyrate dehydrogenase-like beta-hydroxyacid dehydrogenase